MDRLYTIFLEYRESIYTYQVKGGSEYDALKNCIDNIDIADILYLGPKRYAELVKVVNNPIVKPQKMNNVVNIWQWAYIFCGELIWVHIILMQSAD